MTKSGRLIVKRKFTNKCVVSNCIKRKWANKYLSEERYNCSKQTVCILGSFGLDKRRCVNNLLKHEIFSTNYDTEDTYPLYIIGKSEIPSKHVIQYSNKQESYKNIDKLAARLSDLNTIRYVKDEHICLSLDIKGDNILNQGKEIIIFPDNKLQFMMSRNLIKSWESKTYVLVMRKSITEQDKFQSDYLSKKRKNLQMLILLYDWDKLYCTSEEDRETMKNEIANELCSGTSLPSVNIKRMFFVNTRMQDDTIDEFERFTTYLSKRMTKKVQKKKLRDSRCNFTRKDMTATSTFDVPNTKQEDTDMEVDLTTTCQLLPTASKPKFQTVLTRPSIAKYIKRLKDMCLSGRKADVAGKCETFNDIFHILESSFNDIIKKETFQIFEDNFNQDIVEFLHIFNKHFNRKTFQIIKNQEMFSDDTKLALNCWNVSINMLGLCCSDVIRREICEDKINVLELVFKYVDEYQEFVPQNIVARRMVEVALYCLCNYFHIPIGQNKGNILKKYLEVLKKYFSLDNNFKEIKLSSCIILSYIISPSDPLSKEILDHLLKVPLSNIGDEYLGISGDIINTAINNLRNNPL